MRATLPTLALLLCASVLGADVGVFVNGDRLAGRVIGRITKRDDGAVTSFSDEAFASLAGLGLTPVTFEDVVPDASMGFSICSGDLMMLELAKAFRPRLAVFCADVDGVFDRDPKLHRGARLLPTVGPTTLSEFSGGSVNADVTGGMRGKLERMLAISSHCEKCMIVNGNVRGRLEGAVRGRKVVSTAVMSR